jgi:hypothetical protein
MRYLWSVPSAVVAWFVAGFAATYLKGLPEGTTLFVPGRLDLLVLGGFTGGVAAGLFVGRIRFTVPLVLVVATSMWWLTGHSVTDQASLITLLVASAVGGLFGAWGTRSSVVAAFALAIPVAWLALRPANQLQDWRWLWQLNGLLVAAGLALLLYVACWRRGWRSAYFWVPLAGFYLVSFGVVAGVRSISQAPAGRSTDETADAATDAFFQSFEPMLREYWPWLVLALLLAIPMVALKLRALPPPPPPPDPYPDRTNDAVLSDDLDWIDRDEPKRRLLPRRQQPAS